jgi:hypothetical protein
MPHLEDDAAPLEVTVSTVAQVSCDCAVCDALLVDPNHFRDCALVDVKRWEMREEIVSSKEAEEHKVVNNLFARLGIQYLVPIGGLRHGGAGLGSRVWRQFQTCSRS